MVNRGLKQKDDRRLFDPLNTEAEVAIHGLIER